MSSTEQQKKYHQYFSSRPTITIVMPSAKRIRFVGGVYLTDKEDEIAFLDNEIKLGHQMIFVKQDQKIVDADALDPLAAIKKKAIEDYVANQARASNPNQDMGSTVPNIGASLQTSRNLSTIAVGSKSKV